jgi:hypothetical protein
MTVDDWIVPLGLRARLGWTEKHDAEAAKVIKEFDLKLPRDRELVRQLAAARVRQGALKWL